MFEIALGDSMARRMLLAALLTALVMRAGAANADPESEKRKIAQCAKDLCSIIQSKSAKGPDLSCDLTKTWAKDEIQKNADSKNIGWGLGSAKCSIKINIKRVDIVNAITSRENTFKTAKLPVVCEIDEKYPISATMAPELKMKGGQSKAVSLNIDDLKGDSLIKGVVWTAATLEETFGILEGDMVREVNRFIQKECPKILAESK